jgi:hypothetical protein
MKEGQLSFPLNFQSNSLSTFMSTRAVRYGGKVSVVNFRNNNTIAVQYGILQYIYILFIFYAPIQILAPKMDNRTALYVK